MSYIVSLIQFEFETELFGKVDVTTDIVYSQSLQQLDSTEPETSTGKLLFKLGNYYLI